MGRLRACFGAKALLRRSSVSGAAIILYLDTEMRRYSVSPRNKRSCSTLAGSNISVIAFKVDGDDFMSE